MSLTLRGCFTVALALSVVGLAASCAPLDDPEPELYEEPVGQVEAPIQGGYVDEGDTNVVGLVNFQYGAICTGSLIGPNLVLTARHCVSPIYQEAPGGGVICGQTVSGNPWNANQFGVTTVTDMFDASYSDFFDVAEIVVTPGEDYLCGNDIALMVLAEPIPATLAKPLVPRVDSKLVESEEYFAVGYGQSSESNYNSSGVRRRRDDLHVYCAEDDCTGVSAYVKVTEWIGDTGICSGDSGGPAIDMQGRVVGVTSRGGPNCSSPIYGSVHQWADWMKETAIHAAEVGGYEPAPWALGHPTDPKFNAPVGGDCEENGCGICWQNECTRYCVDDAGCPEGYQCDEVKEGTKVCAEIPPPPPKPQPATDGDDEGCHVADAPGADPTNPVPWMVGVGGLALVLARRRRKL